MPTILFLVSKSKETARNAECIADTLKQKEYQVRYISGNIFSHIFALCFYTYDAVHIHGAEASSCMRLKNLIAFKAPIICTVHEREEFEPNCSGLYRAVIHVRRRMMVRYASELITSTKHFQHFIYERYGRIPRYIPNGIPNYQKDMHRTSNTYKRGFTLVTEHEDPRAVSRLSRIGQKRGSRPRSISVLTPASTNEKIQTALNTTSVAVIMSPVYSQSLLMQIAASPIPIIAIDIQPHREHLGAEVIYLSDGSTKELRAALLRLRSNGSTFRNGAMARSRRMSSLYSWDHVTEEYGTLYNRPYNVSVPLDSLIKSASGKA